MGESSIIGRPPSHRRCRRRRRIRVARAIGPGGCRGLRLRPRNISSIRSVTTKPPTRLAVASTTARSASREGPSVGRLAGDDDRADQDDAVDRVRARHERGVQGARDLRDHLEAHEHREHGDREQGDAVHQRGPSCSSGREGIGGRERLGGRRMPHLAVVREARVQHDHVAEVGFDRPVVRHQGEEVGDVLGVEARGVGRHGRRGILHADDRHGAAPVGGRHGDILARHRALDVAAGLRGEVDDDRARAASRAPCRRSRAAGPDGPGSPRS